MSASKAIALALAIIAAALAITAFTFLVATGRLRPQEIGHNVLGQSVSESCCEREPASECCPELVAMPCSDEHALQASDTKETGSKP